MPRTERIKSNTKIYHVICRGINKQDIFLDKQDLLKYVKELKITKEKYRYDILAYAFMNDHIHFIIYDRNDNMSIAIQSLNVRYSMYFNKKYERTGHLFENRFKSKAIENEKYLKTVVRYIHKNPENAGKKPYIDTSYNEYLYKEDLINSNLILKFFGKNRKEALENFIFFHSNYMNEENLDKDLELVTKITDEEAVNIIKKMLKEDNLLKIQKYERNKKYNIISKILKIEGIKKQQISRITGINRKTIGTIEKITQKGQIPHLETSLLGNGGKYGKSK